MQLLQEGLISEDRWTISKAIALLLEPISINGLCFESVPDAGPDESARELQYPEVVLVIHLVSDQNASELRQPRDGAFDNPTPRRIPLRVWRIRRLSGTLASVVDVFVGDMV